MCDSLLTSLTDILIFNSDINREYIFHHSTHYKMLAFEKLRHELFKFVIQDKNFERSINSRQRNSVYF